VLYRRPVRQPYIPLQDSPFGTDRVHQEILVFNCTDSGVQPEGFWVEGRSSEYFSLNTFSLST